MNLQLYLLGLVKVLKCCQGRIYVSKTNFVMHVYGQIVIHDNRFQIIFPN